MLMTINVTKFVKTPFCLVRIYWIVDGSSGLTECEAWEAQYEIECLERAGYTIKSIEKGE